MQIAPPAKQQVIKQIGDKKAQTPAVVKVNSAIILTRNIFAALIDVPKKKEAKTDLNSIGKLEETTLDVILLGTITGEDGDMRAVIYDKSKKKQELFSIGDYIQEAEIKKIIRGKVVLNYNGRDEILDMSNSKDYKPPAVAVTPVVRQPRVVPGRTIPNVRKPKPVPIRRSKRVIPRTMKR